MHPHRFARASSSLKQRFKEWILEIPAVVYVTFGALFAWICPFMLFAVGFAMPSLIPMLRSLLWLLVVVGCGFFVMGLLQAVIEYSETNVNGC